VDGDITCKTLVVAEGAVFCGRSLMAEPPLEGGRQRTRHD
jgi:cytoskeletal protein CcmA (bactofilin family)